MFEECLDHTPPSMNMSTLNLHVPILEKVNLKSVIIRVGGHLPTIGPNVHPRIISTLILLKVGDFEFGRDNHARN